ncbi:hypothetical protein LBMAG49_10980 [Planctomycetota bacterium]|nr:hypothetical protein LBMAG49_10980 [Planctomycetota bacterium]
MHSTRYLFGLLILLLTTFGAASLWRMFNRAEVQKGISLSVEFHDAHGLRLGADVRYRGVAVGMVSSVQIIADGSSAIVGLQLDPEGAAQACVNSVFWIVSPRFAGLASGISGLDTLVRDTYIAFVTPHERGSLLHKGTVFGGSERPPVQSDKEALAPLIHGDLLMTLLVPENHNLKVGSPVIFRGTTTGEVRSVGLAEDGTHVELELRIAHAYRKTVTDRSAFWVARPQLSGALLTGFSVADVNALLQPFVNYYTRPGEGVMVEDGYCTAAATARPDAESDEVPNSALQPKLKGGQVDNDPVVLVRIVYTAVEQDLFSPSDAVHHEGTGVLFLDGSGRPAVLVPRSAADGNYTESDPFDGDPEIAEEQIKVLVPSGPVLRAHRIWIDPHGRDLAVLVLEDAPPDLRITPADRLSFDEAKSDGLAAKVRAVRGDGAARPQVDVQLPKVKPDLDLYRGGPVQVDGVVIGLYGQRARHESESMIVPLDSVPVDLRPKG